jgi:hypothetical protein
VAVELSCFALGDLVGLTVPGELFVEYQLELRRRLAPRKVLLIGYANGWPGYIPTREAFAEGGYGVDPFPGDPPALSRTALPEEAGERILEELAEMAAKT